MTTGFVAMGIRYLKRKYRQAKPWFDRIVGALLLLLCSPVILVCALLVKLTSRGPAFYLQERVGENGRLFRIIKLRTMIADAERVSGPVWAAAEDPRVTRVGRVLRRLHLDELPQLANVMRGHMSLVGPRPERPHFVNTLRTRIPGYEDRFRVKPGITGLAQVTNGPDQTEEDVRKKLELDRQYMQQMCWGMDFMLMARTVKKVTAYRHRKEGEHAHSY